MSSDAVPAATTPDEFEAIARDDVRVVALAKRIAARHEPSAPIERFSGGSLPVFAVGDAFALKCFPPCYARETDIERDGLLALDGRLPLPSPKVVASGEMDGWTYVLMTRLRGRILADVWSEIPGPRRAELVEEIGAALAAMHSIDVASIGPGVPRPVWRDFVARQRERCVERQRSRGLAPEWLEQIPAFLDAVRFDEAPSPVLLHTELMREHLLVDEDGKLSGLFDLEPSMIGDPDYDFASTAIFVTSGDRELVRRFIAGYGRDPGARVVMAYALLHKYSKLTWYLERVPPPPTVKTLEELARVWWPT
jgi:hygromycin-B 7''-O-kinase